MERRLKPEKFKFHRSLMEIFKLYLPYEERPQTQSNFNPSSYGPDYMNNLDKFWEVCKISMQIGN